MRLAGVLVFVLLLFCSCSSLPPLTPVDRFAFEHIQARCSELFPQDKWQFVHYIEAAPPGGKKAFTMGVTVISPAAGTIDCAMMTLEGFVLFDAGYDETLTIRRAVPPFDRTSFAEGLMNDIRFIFFKPKGALVGIGVLNDGARVCRYKEMDGSTIDMIVYVDGIWEKRQYNKTKHVIRSVKADSLKTAPGSSLIIADHLELKAHSLIGYTLSMELIDAVAVTE
jgi:hypothetical protein